MLAEIAISFILTILLFISTVSSNGTTTVSISNFGTITTTSSTLVYADNIAVIMDGQYGDYSLKNNLSGVISTLSANHIKYAVVFVGFWDVSNPIAPSIQYQYSSSFYSSMCASFLAAGIVPIAWGESYPEHGVGTPDLTVPANIAGFNTAVAGCMALGFSGYCEDMEIYTGNLIQWIAYHNQQAVMLHGIGKLAMPGVPMDWEETINPYLHVDFMQVMFYGYNSNFESPNADGWFQEVFGEYAGRGPPKPPASPIIFGICNQLNVNPLSWQLNELKRCMGLYGTPNLAGFQIYNYESMGRVGDPNDWAQWNNWIANFTK